ncbi:phosphoethanolamine transferase [Actinobacillus seminis]|uniref:phosphoethanolamine transferase n=1 Tax=Actinobacillus seminis TaxID=722 RepID=UPI003B9635E9
MKLTINKKTLFVLLGYPLFFLLSEIAYRFLFDLPNLGKYLETYAFFFAFVLLFYYAKWKVTRFVIFGFFAVSQIFNAVHWQVYQNFINSTNYILFFKEITEVLHAGTSMLNIVIPVFLYALFETGIFWTIGLFRKKTSVNKPYGDLFFYLIFIYMFIRSFYSHQEFGLTSNPAYSRIKHNFFTISHLFGKALPYQLFDLSDVEKYHLRAPQVVDKPSVKNIVLIMGESLTATHVNAFGYERETMPFITSLSQEKPHTLLKESYSAGLMTANSLPAFFNAVPRPNGLEQIMKGNTNLFRLAEMQGFDTYFYSSQPEREMAIMSIMGKTWISHQIMPTQLGYDPYQGMHDHKLIPLFEKIDLTKGNHFIVLHQRGSHSVYGEYLSDDEKKFKGNTILDNYDSTIYNTDQFIEKVYHHLEKHSQGDYILIYTSDHGQYVTDTVYNQGTMKESSYLVPAFIYSSNKQVLDKIASLKMCKRLFHQQLATFIINVMGFDMPISTCQKGVINSSVLTGDSGYLEVEMMQKPSLIVPQRATDN